MELTPEPDSITQQGTPFSTDWMNHLEQGVYDAYLHSGRNLLDNADFGYSLVNQRGFIRNASNTYCVDRWIGKGLNADLAQGGIKFVTGDTIKQYLEIHPSYLWGQTCTFSMQNQATGGIESVTLSFPSRLPTSTQTKVENTKVIGTNFDVTVGFEYFSQAQTFGTRTINAAPYIIFESNSTEAVVFDRFWLELGDTSHMLLTPPVRYADVYRRCRQFYRKEFRYRGFGISKRASFDNWIEVIIPLQDKMRNYPSVSNYNTTFLGSSPPTISRHDYYNAEAGIYMRFYPTSSVTPSLTYDVEFVGDLVADF